MKICKNCTNPSEDSAKFCVNCGAGEFISEDSGGEEHSADIVPVEDDIYEENHSEVNSLDIIEVKKEIPAITVKWPKWVKAAVFLMSSSILIIVAILFFWIIAGEDTAYELDEPAHTLVAVPTNLVGATGSSAQAILESLGFVVVVEGVYHNSVAAGNVIAQNPRSGLLQSGDSVSLYISLGRQSVIMPDLVGLTREEATAVLARINIGFFFIPEREYSESIAHNNVIRQYPPRGTELFESSHITFTVSLGLPPADTPEILPRFTISYIANGGLGAMSPVLVEQGQAHVVLASQFTRSGFAFEGWNTMPDGSGVLFAPGTIINTVLVDINLFAQWRDIQIADEDQTNGDVAHIAVTHLVNVPTTGRVNIPVSLSGTVMPIGATVRSPVHWSVIAGGGVSISGSVLTVSQAGLVTVRATIPNGRAEGSDFIQDFTITITGELPAIISPAGAIGEYGTAGSTQLSFTGTPTSFALSGNVPEGVTITNTGVVSWTEATPAGVWVFYITATNQHGPSLAHSFTLINGFPPIPED